MGNITDRHTFRPDNKRGRSRAKMVVERGSRKEGNVWSKTEGRGQTYGLGLKDELIKANVISIPDIIQHVSAKQADTMCLGTRELLSRSYIEEGGKRLEKMHYGDYQWTTYGEVNEKMLKFAASLSTLGLKKGSRVCMLGETRADWYISAAGILRAGMTIVTLYTNLTEAGLVHGILETEVTTIVTSYEQASRIVPLLDQFPLVTNVIIMEDQLEGAGKFEDPSSRVTFLPFKELLGKGDEVTLEKLEDITPHDLAIIMYTSGSTGKPKGVELTHNNILYAMLGYIIQADLGPGDRYIAYLPLAHVMELATETSLLAMGVSILYSSPFTLTDKSPKIKPGTTGDSKCGKPTAMNAVPLILDRIIKGVAVNVEGMGQVKSSIFKAAVKYRQRDHWGSLSFFNRSLDVLIFNKVKAELGGELKQLVVGGSPFSSESHTKIRALFGCTVQVGYGATETAASITSMDSDDPRPGHCGPPNYGVMIKLVDWEEGDYKVSDSPRSRGEIIVGGPTVARGYFKLPEETANMFYEDNGNRWVRTGDIGEFDETGVLYIIDRKKDLVKLKHGEYISLGHIESILKTHALVENICVFAHAGKESSVAVIVPNKESLKKLHSKFEEDVDFQELCKDENIIKESLKVIQNHGKKQGLSKWDIPSAIHLSPTIWMPESGLVTAAFKLRRKPLENHFEDEIKHMYGS